MSAPLPTVLAQGVVYTVREWVEHLRVLADRTRDRDTREMLDAFMERIECYADRMEAAKDARLGALPEPRFDSRGGYLVESQNDALAVAVAALRFVLTCETAYHAQGPAAVAHAMAGAARQALDAIAAARREVRP